MNFLKKKTLLSSFALIVALLMSHPLKAQGYDYTDNELKTFGKLLVEVITIQQQSQREMITAIEENKLTIPRFNELIGQFQASGEEGLEGSEEEIAAFYVVANALNDLQEKMFQKLNQALEAREMTLERYESILADYQADAKLKEKVHALAE